ncbi:hypothetical protein PAXINDRAFT_20932 [Paxillus involutus ATCC 200175]|uniref:Unplaced genomic scaffold PAXINscaffold_1361, whole genome shotgun sequence n=1 Tax=Paxillus involutus ATCC 200175 TaxID=664439 RepID=A0A0C9TF00_PAXIN|nr:hypothetical protein PAXINDRAFT_20932 [Paxillus involutus ATCC 200175]
MCDVDDRLDSRVEGGILGSKRGELGFSAVHVGPANLQRAGRPYQCFTLSCTPFNVSGRKIFQGTSAPSLSQIMVRRRL